MYKMYQWTFRTGTHEHNEEPTSGSNDALLEAIFRNLKISHLHTLCSDAKVISKYQRLFES